MAQVTAPLTQLLYNGLYTTLATAPFLEKVLYIYRLNDAGKGWVTFVPNSQLNPFTALETGRSYIIHSLQLPYEIPEATGAAPPTVAGLGLTNDADFLTNQ